MFDIKITGFLQIKCYLGIYQGHIMCTSNVMYLNYFLVLIKVLYNL